MQVWRTKGDGAWRMGHDREVGWIQERTEGGLAITSAIPPVFEAYATLELPGTGDHDAASWLENPQRHDAGVLAVLRASASAHRRNRRPQRLGVCADRGWPRAGGDVARRSAKGVLPDLTFPADRSWLVSTLWDDDWTCIGGSKNLVGAFLAHSDLRHRAREVDSSVKDATPPGHAAI
jgi:hypothetical protein